jgi:hypothetical protein
MMNADPADLWRLLPIGYVLSVLLEAPVLLVGLSWRHSLSRRLISAVWLTACTYPIVILVLPQLIWRPLGDSGYWPYVAVAEIFAPAAECFLFWLAFWRGAPEKFVYRDFLRDMAAIVAANLTSFLVGAWLLRLLSY